MGVSFFSTAHTDTALKPLRCFVSEDVSDCKIDRNEFEGYSCIKTISSNIREIGTIQMVVDFETSTGNKYYPGTFKGEIDAGKSHYRINAIAQTFVYKDMSEIENYLDLKIEDQNNGDFLISYDGRPRTDAFIQTRYFTTENSQNQMHRVDFYCKL